MALLGRLDCSFCVALNLAKLDILVLEDDTVLSKGTAALLERLDADVSLAPTLQAVRTLLTALAFDIALLDVNLADGLGADRLRERAFGLDTTVVGPRTPDSTGREASPQ